MMRTSLTFVRRLFCAVALLLLSVCGAEVAVRTYEFVGHKDVCAELCGDDAVDPTGLLVPSWSINREMKPHAVAKVLCRDSKREVPIRTNSLGLRGPEVGVPKPSGVYRIVVLGDESIFAPETPEQDHFIRLLGDLLQPRSSWKIDVVNAGLPGGCPLTEYLLFKQKLLALQPDLVLMHIDWSDVSDDQQLRRRTRCERDGTPLSCPHALLASTKRVTQPVDDLRQKFRLVDWGLTVASREWKEMLAEQSASSRDLESNPYAFLRDEHLDENPVFQQALSPVADMDRLSRSVGFQLAVITSPKPWQVSSKCSTGKGVRLASGVSDEAYYPGKAPFELLARYAISLRLQFADATMTITSDRADDNFLRHAPRWSREGHRRMAGFLAGFLHERIRGPWNASSHSQPVPNMTRIPHLESGIQWTSGER